MTVEKISRNNKTIHVTWLFAIYILIFLGGCAIKLAPDYDRSIISGLGSANEKALVLYAEVSSGTSNDTYVDREASYNRTIGAFDALRLQARARPTPRPYIVQMFGLGTPTTGEPDAVQKLEVPTEAILEQIVLNISSLRDIDKTTGLRTTVVTGLKQSYETSIDQALTYEKALER